MRRKINCGNCQHYSVKKKWCKAPVPLSIDSIDPGKFNMEPQHGVGCKAFKQKEQA